MLPPTASLRARLHLAALVLAFVGSTTAFAQPSPESSAAQQHYAAGREAASRGDHGTAVRELRAAYDLTRDPALLREIADAEEAAGQPGEAAATLRRYLEQAQAPADAADVQARIERLEQRAAAAPAPGPTTQPAADPGRDVEEPVTLPPGALGGTPTFMDEPPRWQRTAAWISVGVAATFAATSGVLAASAASREDDIERLLNYRDPVTGRPAVFTGRVREDYIDSRDEGEMLERWSLYSLAAAGGAAVAATIFFLIDPGPAATLEPYTSGDGLGVTTVVRF